MVFLPSPEESSACRRLDISSTINVGVMVVKYSSKMTETIGAPSFVTLDAA